MKCNINERLYLYKGEQQSEDVYIDCPILPQHQINALRFIYHQYIKKNPGIILNDPAGYGKIIEVVLFIKAIKHLLNEPVIVICDDDEIDAWVGNFQKWADLTEEVAVNPSNPFIKGKKVLIASWSHFERFCRKNSSVLVIHNDKPKRELFKYKFETDYKIWVTSEDMKEDLESFITIYQWFKPKANIRLLRHNGTELEKKILVDAFMQDVVIRGRGYESPEIRIQKVKTTPEKLVNNSHKNKNKDATGTKTKRSKKNVNEANIPLEIDAIKVATDEHNDLKNHGYNSNKNISPQNKARNRYNERSEPKKRIKLGQVREVTDSAAIAVIEVKNEVMEIEVSDGHTKCMKHVYSNDPNLIDNDRNQISNIDVNIENSQDIRLRYPETDSVGNDGHMDVDKESPSILSFKGDATKKDYNREHDGNHATVLNTEVIDEKCNNVGDSVNEIVNFGNDLNKNHSDGDVEEFKEINDVEIGPDASKITADSKSLGNKTFDSIMDEMQENVNKKYKGSLLDKLI